MHFRHILISGISALALALVFSGNQQVAAADKPELQVVASVDFYGEAAQAVLGQYGHVQTIIDQPNIDPHDYTPTTKVGKQVAHADVVIYNGAGYDTWMTKLLKNKSKQTQKVAVAKLVGVKAGQNEHVWYKPQTMPKLANTLAKRFGQLDAAHQSQYRQNAKAYIASLKPLLKVIKQVKAQADHQSVAVSEPVFDHALRHLGYRVSNAHFARAIEAGSDPSPADVRQLDAAIKHRKLVFFVQNTQVHSPIVTEIVKRCRQAKVPVLAVTETMPKGQDYRQWMMTQYQALAKIQAAKR
ncbi:metal ABC transporter solute-binding protein, Zn/Mn family [Lacticaseibacillus baoqingensis]|uniref:Metal ABC transporter solute-binding protein, Zn/Mn family n=1 Tax=Lacticaseibacillus baoqingensis TaxID=2486013 RepID=A0ABW4E885_9LACO|nr:zinc ABC transporter substrate-binding protein [Lacticaseibacillus baoqingensis]